MARRHAVLDCQRAQGAPAPWVPGARFELALCGPEPHVLPLDDPGMGVRFAPGRSIHPNECGQESPMTEI